MPGAQGVVVRGEEAAGHLAGSKVCAPGCRRMGFILPGSGTAASSPAAYLCNEHKLSFPFAFGGYLPMKHRVLEDVLSEMEEIVQRGASLLPPHGRGYCSPVFDVRGSRKGSAEPLWGFFPPPPWLPSRAWSPSDVSGLPAGLDVLPAFLRL